jgi:hypothetical protein
LLYNCDDYPHGLYFITLRNYTFFGKSIRMLLIEENPLLETLEPLAFSGLADLKYLSLKHNRIKVASSGDNFFVTFKKLVMTLCPLRSVN